MIKSFKFQVDKHIFGGIFDSNSIVHLSFMITQTMSDDGCDMVKG